MKPSEKSPEMEKLLDKILNRSYCIKNDVCTVCGESVWNLGFRDELSKKEYTISGLCQDCQDKVFVDE